MIKVVASDLDGTLIPEGTQEVENGFFDVLEELLDKGYQFYVASGRQYANIRQVFERFADRIGFICENGAIVMEKEQLEYMYEIPRDIALSVCEDILSIPEADAYISGVKSCYIKPRTEWFRHHLVDELQNACEFIETPDEIDDKIVKIAMHIYDFDQNFERIRDFFQEKYGDYANFGHAGNSWLDMMPKDSGKGYALRHVLEKKEMKPENLIVFGDNYNDISMFEATPNSYVMAHAKDDVKQHAAYECVKVTDTLREFLKKS